MQKPLISVAVPAYNCEAFIGEMIESVQAQSYPNWELVIVDDCSNDKTADIISGYADADKRITLIKRKENSGGCRLPRFEAILSANGQYVCPIDADDAIEPEYIEKLYNRKLTTNADIVTGVMNLTDIHLHPDGRFIPNELVDKNKIYSGKEACRMTIGRWDIACAGLLTATDYYKDYIRQNINNEYNGPFSDELDHRKILLGANTVAMCDADYYYRMVHSSIIHAVNYKSLIHHRDLLSFVFKNFENDEGVKESMVKLYASNVFHSFVSYYRNSKDTDTLKQKKINKRLILYEVKNLMQYKQYIHDSKYKVILTNTKLFNLTAYLMAKFARR